MSERRSQLNDRIRLLCEVIPATRVAPQFGIKGGTAINLFHCDFPRATVDLDLTYVPTESRSEDLRGIEDGLLSMKQEIERVIPGASAKEERIGDEKFLTKLEVFARSETVIVEANLVLRGSVEPPEKKVPCRTIRE